MRLTEDIKKRIDNYFENISAEKLYDISVNKYGFQECFNIESEGDFYVIGRQYYASQQDNSVDVDDDNLSPLAA